MATAAPPSNKTALSEKSIIDNGNADGKYSYHWVMCVTLCAVSVLSLWLAADAPRQLYLAARASALLPL